MTRQKKELFIVVLIGLLLFSTTLFADVPALMDYQGRLTDDNGDPVNGSVSIEFKIYADSTGGVALWTETQSVDVSDGLFQVSLGAVTTLDLTFEDDAHWLGINVAADGEMTPRTQIVSVAYAINAGDVKGNDIHPATVSIDGYGAVINSSGEWTGETIPTSGDNLGDHTATENLDMDSNKIVNLTTPAAATDAATKGYVDSAAGDDLGNHTATSNLNMAYHKIENLTTPTANYDAATKLYVDSNAGDNLGDHTATQNVELNGNWLSNDGGSEGVFVATDGDVGIGTSSPYGALEVVGDGSNTGGLRVTGLGNTVCSNIFLNAQNKDWTISAHNPSSSTGDQKFAIRDYTLAQNRLVIDADGDIGIGTDSPSSKLDVVGTVTADAFVGDGSGLTGVTAPGDNLGDHTATQNVELNGNWLSNDGGSEGVFVATDGDVGIGTSSPGAVLDVYGSGTYGLRVTETSGADTKFEIEPYGEMTLSYGSYEHVRIGSDAGPAGFLQLTDTGTTRVRISSDAGAVSYFNAGNVGIGTSSPSEELEVNGKIEVEDGLKVNDAPNDGIYIYNAGSSVTSHPTSTGNNGIEVVGVQDYGLYVGRADATGVYINSTAGAAIEIDEAGYEGIMINSVGNAYSPYGTGVKVTTATADGFYVGSAGDDGFVVNSAVGQGFYVNDCEDGVFVNDATDDGVYVSYADDRAFYGRTTDLANEWGLYTPDKIYGLNVTSRGNSGYGKNVGSSSLEAGDIVCIAGGIDERVLGDDGLPAVYVEKADGNNSKAVYGVVEYKVVRKEEREELDDGTTQTDISFEYAEGSATQGEYLSIIVFGIAEVKVDREAVRSGESLTAGDNAARKVKTTEVNGIEIAENVGVLGKALEDSNGRGKIKVFVNCK